MIDFITPSSGIFFNMYSIFKSQKLKGDKKLCGQEDRITGTHIEKRPQGSLSNCDYRLASGYSKSTDSPTRPSDVNYLVEH